MNEPDDRKAVERKLLLIDQALDRQGLALRFPDELEDQFEEESGPHAARNYVRMGLLSLVLFNLLIVLDYFALPDIFWLAVALRLGAGTAIMGLSIWITSRNPSAAVREGLAVASAVTIGAIVYVMVAASSSPLRDDYHLGILFVQMFMVMVMRLRFGYAALTAGLLVVIQMMALFSISEEPIESRVAAGFLSISISALALMAAHNMERLERLSWLRSLGDRLRARAFEELSVIDPLTGLGNRRALQQWVDKQRSSNEHENVSVIIADIDYFKSYNDTYGHLAGDDCLRRVSSMLIAEARNTNDRVFRFGGEEFIVFLAGIELPAAAAVAERMRRAIVARRIPHKTHMGPDCVTSSFGVSSGKLTADFDLDLLIQEADRALYQAEQEGRNRVVPPFVALAGDLRAAG